MEKRGSLSRQFSFSSELSDSLKLLKSVNDGKLQLMLIPHATLMKLRLYVDHIKKLSFPSFQLVIG